MVQSTERPARIHIISVRDDIKANKCVVQYAMNFAITEKQIEEQIPDPETGETITQTKTVFEYYQITSELTLDLFLKPFLLDALKHIYEQLEPTVLERISFAAADIPKELDW